MEPELYSIIKNFSIPPGKAEFVKLSRGKIHDTFFVKFDSAEQKCEFVLQKINTYVFSDIDALMHNFMTVTELLKNRGKRTLSVVNAVNGKSYYRNEADKTCWRLTGYIGNSVVFEKAEIKPVAFEAGKLLADFHETVSECSVDNIKSHVKDFHNTEKYFSILKNIMNDKKTPLTPEVLKVFQFIEKREEVINEFSSADTRGILKPFICHNDPKLNNMLFDKSSLKGICLIDLDTIDTGFLPYDTGDALRSICTVKNETKDCYAFDLERMQEFMKGYMSIMKSKLVPDDVSLLYEGIRLVMLELSIRYLSDYLTGAKYFALLSSDEIFRNALKQQNVCMDLEAHEKEAKKIILSEFIKAGELKGS